MNKGCCNIPGGTATAKRVQFEKRIMFLQFQLEEIFVGLEHPGQKSFQVQYGIGLIFIELLALETPFVLVSTKPRKPQTEQSPCPRFPRFPSFRKNTSFSTV